ncbi:MAG: hypothetical protein ABEJ62_02950 [Candidatus Nanohaloarchaea archaeon]
MGKLDKYLAAVLLLLLVPAAGAVTTYDIRLHGDSADINVTVELYPEVQGRDVRLSTTWLLPENTDVGSVSDSEGPIRDYEVSGNRVRFETLIEEDENREVVEIHGRIEDVRKDEYRGLDRVQLQLSGFRDSRPEVPEEVTQVHVESDRSILAESHSFGFNTSLRNRSVKYAGTGPLNLQMSVSGGGESYDHFQLFGTGNLSTADDLYWLPAAVTGFIPQVNRWPVVVYPDEVYDSKVDRWSAGQYRRGGVIFVRNSTLQSNEGPAVVLHEVMHGFNEQALQWTTATRSWFDEGTASYVEWLVNEKRGVRQAEIFGEEVSWVEGNTRYTLPPRKEPGDLWDYYSEGRTYMRGWTLFNTTVDRTFGYAYSELLIRRYVMENGPASLRDVYSGLLDLNSRYNRTVEDVGESNQAILDVMNASFRPCYSSEREEVFDCLERVHEMEAKIPELGDVEDRTGKVRIRKVKPPEEGLVQKDNGNAAEERNQSPANTTMEPRTGFWKELFELLNSILQRLERFLF